MGRRPTSFGVIHPLFVQKMQMLGKSLLTLLGNISLPLTKFTNISTKATQSSAVVVYGKYGTNIKTTQENYELL